ncbi:MAG: Putative ABC-type transport system, periplasmic component/surface lipoprotein [Caldanaerobacter subterraneus]|uniref:BMP family ABC transporter substrate-binding protein n=1 Tax=Caldanaerobacter subterraneus TaxID=911092 RepID=A0A101E4V1_9THEO|nr:BMP family ABC transporter substrate-binding protein [Caldanaerobacter subterraneus]KUK08894.1 MAG: Putative ABC-type transport system, periplasmic component/surface lipoprotein [Caldanaerobacter subterraneus]TCO68656.1 nucleoside-binding protein [Caldanaerobacter subterraneus]HBT50228.1 BMP family ABC transporter substrate-binding protein [Caldanaerobacter subterraneus]
MRKIIVFAVILSLMFIFGLTGCGKNSEVSKEQTTVADSKEKPLKIVLLINGTLGDKSFFDSANHGIELIKKEYGDKVITKVIEMSYDNSKWEPTLQDVSEQDWDIIIVGTWQMAEYLQKLAPQYPEKKYIIFDTSVDYSKGNLSNVYSILYKQNEGSFLAGALAAKIANSNMPLVTGKKLIGFLGGMDIPVINDFLVGYIQGAQYVDKDIKVAISYIGDFSDSAKGKELALAQYQQGATIGFNVAGQAGLGQLDAAKEMKRYAIGVDSDQALLFAESDPEKANLIVTSMLKRVDNSLLRAIKLYKEGNLKFGEAEALGLKEEAVGLADNEYYRKLVPEDIRQFIEDLKTKIINGEIKVDSAFGMDTNKLNEIRNAVKP